MSLGAAKFSFVKLRWAMAGCNWCRVLRANCGFQLAGMTFAGACLEHHKWRWRTLRYPNQRAYSVAIASVCVCVWVRACVFVSFCVFLLCGSYLLGRGVLRPEVHKALVLKDTVVVRLINGQGQHEISPRF